MNKGGGFGETIMRAPAETARKHQGPIQLLSFRILRFSSFIPRRRRLLGGLNHRFRFFRRLGF